MSSEQAPRTIPAWKIGFYRQCRLWHGWLSAFAFLALMFFSATGLLLNHPDWFAGDAPPQERQIQVNPSELKGKDAAAMGAMLSDRKQVQGVYATGDIDSGLAMLRFEGVRGESSVTLDLETGKADISYRKATMLTLLNDLHRGKNAGAAWKGLIDISAILFLVLSLLGYLLFISMRFKLPQALILTAISAAALAGIFLLLVP